MPNTKQKTKLWKTTILEASVETGSVINCHHKGTGRNKCITARTRSCCICQRCVALHYVCFNMWDRGRDLKLGSNEAVNVSVCVVACPCDRALS